MKINFSANLNTRYPVNRAAMIKPYSAHPVCQVQQKHEEKTNRKLTKYLAYGAGIGALLFAGLKLLKGNSPKKSGEVIKNAGVQSCEMLKEKYNAIIKRFPKDEQYYSKLASGIGLGKGEGYRLASIVGEEQLTHLLKTDFSPIDFKLGENFEGIVNNTFRVNLHNHTNFSDGKLSVEAFLEQARLWADRMHSKSNCTKKPPFTIAITDHDTMEGCKEVLKLVSQQPEKYKNLKIVLGSEISVSHLNPQHTLRPFNFELIGYSINPFNKELNSLLNSTVNNRINLVHKLTDTLAQQYPQLNLSYEEAANFHPNLAKGTSNGSVWLIDEYAKFKMCFQDMVNQINLGIEKEEDKLDVGKLMSKYAKDYYHKMDTEQDGITRGNLFRYFETLKTIEGHKAPMFDKSKSDFKMLDNITHLRDKYVFDSNTMLKEGIVLTPEMVFDATKRGGNEGFFGIAHPGFFNLEDCRWSKDFQQHCQQQGKDPYLHFVFTVIKSMKDKGGKLFSAIEANYQSYGNDKGREKWGKQIFEIAKSGGTDLLKAGGVDCHQSIFTKHEKLSTQIINKLDISEIIGGN